jgi:hypothetical protein
MEWQMNDVFGDLHPLLPHATQALHRLLTNPVDWFIAAVLWCDISLCETDQWALSLRVTPPTPRMSFAHSSFATRVAVRWLSVLRFHVYGEDAQLLVWTVQSSYEKALHVQLVTKFDAYYGAHIFFYVFAKSHHWSWSGADDNNRPISFLFESSLNVRQGIPSDLQTSPTKPYIHFSSFPCVRSSMSQSSYDGPHNICPGLKVMNLWSSSFLQPSVTCCIVNQIVSAVALIGSVGGGLRGSCAAGLGNKMNIFKLKKYIVCSNSLH